MFVCIYIYLLYFNSEYIDSASYQFLITSVVKIRFYLLLKCLPTSSFVTITAGYEISFPSCVFPLPFSLMCGYLSSPLCWCVCVCVPVGVVLWLPSDYPVQARLQSFISSPCSTSSPVFPSPLPGCCFSPFGF